MSEVVDIDHLKRWVGREEVAEDLLTAETARRFHATLDLPGAPPGEGEVAPRLIHWCLAQPALPQSELGSDGHPRRGGFLPPVPLPRRMWAGGSLSFAGDLKVGDRVTRRSRIDSVALKEGRSGRLCFVAVAHSLEAGGKTVAQERQDLVYRDLDAGGPAPELPPAAQGEHRRRVEPTTTLLFRYSALTFNGHRIHYDRDHAVKAEGYDGLVVHGPMQATMLLHLAATIAGRPPAGFDYRGRSPLTDTQPFELHASGGADGIRLWTARAGGPEAMTAQARW